MRHAIDQILIDAAGECFAQLEAEVLDVGFFLDRRERTLLLRALFFKLVSRSHSPIVPADGKLTTAPTPHVGCASAHRTLRATGSSLSVLRSGFMWHRRLARVLLMSIRFAADPAYFFVVLLLGTFPPSLLASDNPIAIACLRLVTFFPDRPLLSSPCFRSCIALCTLSCAFFPYLAMSAPD
jgi:hypothetical protein